MTSVAEPSPMASPLISTEDAEMEARKRLLAPVVAAAPPGATTLAPQSSDAFMRQALTITVFGASGDLAKKKTYPSLFDLYRHSLLPRHVTIVGFARSRKTPEEFRNQIRAYLDAAGDEALLDSFLEHCFYEAGAYDTEASFHALCSKLGDWEIAQEAGEVANRLFYFAVPPSVFVAVARNVKAACMAPDGWSRLILEKPFGHDYDSAVQMVSDINASFDEDQIYRIDHYLGKEMVQNLIMLRFGNLFLEPLMSKNYVKAVKICFKEDFGTMGRGGYFDSSGIIRDIMQNHLMQVLSLIAMEPPARLDGETASAHIRDAKVALLQSVETVRMEDVVVGQYVGDDQGHEGYRDDPTVPDDSRTPTYACAVLRVNNARWEGVPFIMKAGKAIDQRKVEVRVQFKDAPNAGGVARNELVLRIQPDEAVYLKCNVKAPGLASGGVCSEMDLTYKRRYAGTYNPDAYTRLLLDTLRGRQATFVRGDELLNAWRIWTPVLQELEKTGVEPLPYTYGSRGPEAGDELVEREGYKHDAAYTWNDTSSSSS